MWDCTESIREIREAEGKEKMEAALKRLKEESSKRECTRKGRPYSSPSFREAASPPLHRLPNDYMPLGHHLLYFPSFNRPSDVMTDGTIPQHHPGLPYGKRLWSGGKVEFKPNWQDKFAMDGRLAICVEKLEDARWPPTVVEKLEKDPAATLDKADQSMIFIDVVRRYGIAPIDIRKQTLNKANISTTISESPDIKETRTLVFFAEDEYAKLTPKKRRGNEPNQEAEKSQYDQNNASTEPAETKRMNRKPKQDDVETIFASVTPMKRDLFHFSALSYNAHEIHLDKSEAQREGYPDVLVQGPYVLLMMFSLLNGQAGVKLAPHPAVRGSGVSIPFYPSQDGLSRYIKSIEYRNVAPLLAGQELKVCAKPFVKAKKLASITSNSNELVLLIHKRIDEMKRQRQFESLVEELEGEGQEQSPKPKGKTEQQSNTVAKKRKKDENFKDEKRTTRAVKKEEKKQKNVGERKISEGIRNANIELEKHEYRQETSDLSSPIHTSSSPSLVLLAPNNPSRYFSMYPSNNTKTPSSEENEIHNLVHDVQTERVDAGEFESINDVKIQPIHSDKAETMENNMVMPIGDKKDPSSSSHNIGEENPSRDIEDDDPYLPRSDTISMWVERPDGRVAARAKVILYQEWELAEAQRKAKVREDTEQWLRNEAFKNIGEIGRNDITNTNTTIRGTLIRRIGT